MNNKILAFILIGCLLLFGISKIFTGHRQSSYDPKISVVDSAKVTRIKFISGGSNHEEFELQKNGDAWEAIQGDKKLVAPERNITGTINQLSHLTAQRLLTKDPARYEEYEITDEKASKVTVWEGNKVVADLLVGGFKFDQAARSASSYVRIADKPEVYLVDGFVSMSLKQNFNLYRDKKLVKVTPDDLSKIDWSDINGTSQTLAKTDNKWQHPGARIVDTTAIKNYLLALTNAQGSEFSKLTSLGGLAPIEKIALNGNNMTEPTVITLYQNVEGPKPFLIRSSVNPEGIFISDSTGLYKQIFKDLRQFWR